MVLWQCPSHKHRGQWGSLFFPHNGTTEENITAEPLKTSSWLPTKRFISFTSIATFTHLSETENVPGFYTGWLGRGQSSPACASRQLLFSSLLPCAQGRPWPWGLDQPHLGNLLQWWMGSLEPHFYVFLHYLSLSLSKNFPVAISGEARETEAGTEDNCAAPLNLADTLCWQKTLALRDNELRVGRSHASCHQQVTGPHNASLEPVSGQVPEILSVQIMYLKRRETSSVQWCQKDKDKKGGNRSRDQVEWNLMETKQETKKVFHSSNKIFPV